MNVEKIAERVRAEFNEMPELQLTVTQAARFFGLDRDIAQSVMERLVGSEFLRWTRGGALARATG